MGLPRGSLEAYALDEAVAFFGNYVTSELGKVKGKTEKQIESKQAVLLAKLLSKPGAKKKFRDPAAMLS